MKIVVTGGAGFLGYHIGTKIHEITKPAESVFFDIAEFPKEDYNPEINCIYGDVRVQSMMDEDRKSVV